MQSRVEAEVVTRREVRVEKRVVPNEPDPAARASEPLLRTGQSAEHLGRWLGVLTLYDVVFVLLSLAVFDYLLED